MATPTAADLATPELSADVEKYYQAATLMGHERVRLFRLAWDLCCSSFAGRQVLYERFFAGDPMTLLAMRYVGYDRTAAEGRVRAFLARAAGAPATGRDGAAPASDDTSSTVADAGSAPQLVPG
jgi:4-hydroxyphenylacetate 3-monooxygenase